VVKVIWYEAASPPHTDDSVVFTMLRQRAHRRVHPNRHLHRTGSAPRWVALNISTAGRVLACRGPTSFHPQNCSFTCGKEKRKEVNLYSAFIVATTLKALRRGSHSFTWDLKWTPSNTWFLGPDRVHIPNRITIGSAVFSGSRSWPADRPRYSICSNRPHIASAAMRPNNTE